MKISFRVGTVDGRFLFYARSVSAKKLAASLRWYRGWTEGVDFVLREEVPGA